MPLGPTQSYLARYNGYQLPGYVQDESFDSVMNIASHYSAYADGSNSEQTGLGNKTITVRLKVWEQDYITCKEQVELAATMVRSKKFDFAPLYIQYEDRYYEAMTKSIKTQKTAGTGVRTLEYDVEFECKPWLVASGVLTLTGTGTINTDQVSRSIDDGGWTPTTIVVTGTNVTISGYTATGDFTGFISISGAVTNMVIDTEAYTAEIGGINKNNLMRSADYQMYIGPGKSFLTTTGASSMTVYYRDRWYL